LGMLRTIRSFALVLFFWAVAAVIVALAHRGIQPVSPLLALAVKMVGVLGAGFFYDRAMRGVTIEHALEVGAAWVVLDIAAEMVITANGGHPWFVLLGAPAAPALRTVALMTWIGASTLFARRPVRG
jgi:hypothetical protein